MASTRYYKLVGRSWQSMVMNTYKRHRFPSDIISHAVWLYFNFNLSHRYILAEHAVTVSYETVRLWCIKFGGLYARRLKRSHRG
jgi:putative transposase